ncbi:Fc.00g023220.m01.CDS01 [Cosmosporella sp. VM-42]
MGHAPIDLHPAGALLERAQNLSTLCISGACNYNNGWGWTSLRRIKSLTLIRDKCSTLWDIIKGCRELSSLTYRQRHVQGSYYEDSRVIFPAYPRDIVDKLGIHQECLKTLRLEVGWQAFVAVDGDSDALLPLLDDIVIETLEDFGCLEELSIPTICFVDKDGPTKLLKTLPVSIRRLEIFKDTNDINSQLFALVKKHRLGSYPNLEEITLRMPERRLRGAKGYLPKLNLACQQAGIKLSIVQSEDFTEDEGCWDPTRASIDVAEMK